VHISIAQHARKLSGTVRDASGEPLPYATVYVEQIKLGTASNAEGSYQLSIPIDTVRVVVRFVGYITLYDTILPGIQDISKDLTLAPERVYLKEVVVTSKKGKYSDPAYGYMRKAIEKRAYHKEAMSRFSCRAYIKGLQRLVNAPKKFMGFDVTLPGLDSTGSGIVYLSESVSEYHKDGENKEKEVMIASKVSGNNNGFSFNSASDFQLSLYDELIAPGQLGPRGMVSPLHDQALLYYTFELLGSTEEQGITLHKIGIQPRRSIDPAFKGVVYLQDGTWRIHAVKIYADKSSNIEFVDSLTIEQLYAPVSQDVWMIQSMRYDFQFKVLAFKGNGYFLGTFDNYNLQPTFASNFFDKEILQITEESNDKDSSYWNEIRPMQLTAEEVTDYTRKDSLSAIWETKAYKDSVDRVRNKFKPLELLTGYRHVNTYEGTSWYWGPLLNNIQFNTVEGWVLDGALSYSKRQRRTGNGYTISARGRYGEASQQAYGTIGYYRQLNATKRTTWSVEGGRMVEQLDQTDPISPLVNTMYTLTNEENFMKLFDRTFATASVGSEVLNGLRLAVAVAYEERASLTNQSTFQWRNEANRTYTPNIPLLLGKHRAATTTLTLTYTIGQEYISMPNRKISLGSNYPTLKAVYRRGIPGIGGSSTDFDRLDLRMSDEVRIGMAGEIKYEAQVTTFLSDFRTDLPDRQVVSGNQTWVIRENTLMPQLLPYYAIATTTALYLGHVRYEPQGLLLNKMPGIRKLKWREAAGMRLLYNDGGNQPYAEWYVGITNILKLFSVEYHQSTLWNGRTLQGFRIGITP
jgi:hypothetical protein